MTLQNIRRLGATMATTAAIACAAGPTNRPNFLILLIDDMCWGDPGCYGGTLAPTPHMDRLAAEGVRFTQGYSTGCICSPSRVGLLTGRYQARTGHDSNTHEGGPKGVERAQRVLDPSEVTIAQRLKAAGYGTGIIGKWHLGANEPWQLPGARGFDVAWGSSGNLGHGAPWYEGTNTVPCPADRLITTPDYTARAIDFIRHPPAHPWFLYISFNAVHGPHAASSNWLAKVQHLPPREQKYAAMIMELDDAIGRILDTIRELNLDRSTLVICTDDNGGAAPLIGHMGGLRGRKWLLYEGGIRVPWIMRWTGRIPAGRVLNTPVIHVDIAPTLLAAAGVELRPEWELDGVNLLPLLEGRVLDPPPRALFWRFGVQYAVREGPWKLVRAGRDVPVALYNLAEDPGEQHDRSAQEPAVVRRLQGLFDEWNAKMKPPRWDDPRWNDGNGYRYTNDAVGAAPLKAPRPGRK